MADIKKAMILAAGKGTRLGELTKTTPKPLIKVGEDPILFRILDALKLRGFEEVVINCFYLKEQMVAAVESWQHRQGEEMKIHVSQEEELLEIGGGVRRALNFLGKSEPFLIVNGDIVWQERRHPLIRDLVAAYDGEQMSSLMCLSPVAHTTHFRKRGGDVHLDIDGQVGFPQNGEETEFVYMGVQVIHPRLVAHLQDGVPAPFKPCWLSAQKEKALHGHIYQGSWADMGTPQGLTVAQELVSY